MGVAILTTETFMFCQDNDSKVRMLLIGFGSTLFVGEKRSFQVFTPQYFDNTLLFKKLLLKRRERNGCW